MRRKLFIFLSLSLLFGLVLTSCSSDDNNDDAPFLGAKIKVTVKNLLGTPQTNTTVYMYKDNLGDTKDTAKKQVVTDENGVATFDLNFTELEILESQTTLYFAVFYGDNLRAGSEGVTVKRNETKNLEITIPL